MAHVTKMNFYSLKCKQVGLSQARPTHSPAQLSLQLPPCPTKQPGPALVLSINWTLECALSTV